MMLEINGRIQIRGRSWPSRRCRRRMRDREPLTVPQQMFIAISEQIMPGVPDYVYRGIAKQRYPAPSVT